LARLRISIAERFTAAPSGGRASTNTTNWAVVTLGIALSVTFSGREASPLPLPLAGVCIVFLIFETRRYRYFNVWRARARWMEKNFYAPMLRDEGVTLDTDWNRRRST
jgi:uncharacterized membrane protein